MYVSSFTRKGQEIRYLGVYERRARNAICRHLREKDKKYDISAFTREGQEMRYIAVYEKTRNPISRRLREEKKCDMSPFTRGQEMRYLAVYERTRNAISRRLREKDKKCDMSPFTKEGQEMQYVAVYEIRLGEAGETCHPTRERKEKSVCVSIALQLFTNNMNNRIIEAIVDQGTITDQTHQ
jgi:hypothetical protein